ncbi:PREDICTED: nuclear pore complex protein Nup153 isoform X1 [Trachymyrmex cornetzi]|uniref:nuclear pore complex protein Nup153 isoform X1 n=1 Tax=Trachymyrmex cornetzi TaxID=471704 RepID=UPI00084F45EE|nr:PREDICTED: nuclear pore complex protein Nup153 isoform X1 [Trachymyrmex cornetzi]XP_018360935.1 PREDICTED: nuclear pore complex protein Nup153 isoform X1 [Trachymyrmex cornetzi]
MPREGGNPAGRRPSSRNAKPYDANNSFVRKMATKVTDFIPQSSWISKWFNTSQSNEDALENTRNIEETELEDDVQQPPSKRSRIRMDVIHPPGTFSIQTRVKTALNTVESSKEQYPIHNEMAEDFATAGPSGIGRLMSSTPAVQADIRTVTSHRSDLNSLTSTNNGIANGMDDNSESSESTSGCSSLIPQINRHEGPSNLLYSSTFTSRKRHLDDKLTFTNHLQSPRSLFLDSNSRDSLSSRRPSFNASIITNAADRASLLSSPFYSGNITFGGANAAGLYKRSRNIFNNSNEIQLKVPRRTNVEVKPSDAVGVDSSGMSQTAKKILEALEHFSSPVSDAKKIPLKNSSNAVSSVNRKRTREEIPNPSARIGLRHLTRELTVPTVPDILKLRRRQKLQDTTLMARKIVSARSDPPPSPQEYRLRTEDTDSEKYRGKLKGKSKINLEQEETVAPVNLPNIPLPITTLPNFNFTLPPPASHSAGKTIANKENSFTFASPIKVTDAGKSLQSVNNFTFSNPLNAEDCANNSTDSRSLTEKEFTVDCAVTSVPNFIWSGSSTAPRLKAKAKNVSMLPQELKSGSVMDVFSKSSKIESNLIGQTNSGLASEMTHTDKTISSDSDITSTHDKESSWECSECMIRNNGTDKQCTACKMPRFNSNDKTLLPSTSTTDTVVETKPIEPDCFGSQFKLSTNQWECTTCCVRNKQSDITCVACTTPKPGSSSAMQQTVKSQNFDLMDKFKPAEGSWECSGCLLRNAANVITCPCCNTSKPTSVKTKPKTTDNVTESSAQKLNTSTEVTATKEILNSEIMNKFKPSKDSWECSGCLVRNNSSVTTCPCCSTPKPNSIGESSKVEQTSSNGFGDKFKKPEGAWTCDSCLLQNDAKHTECVACQASKPGTVKLNESSSSGSTLQFKFGVSSGTTNLTNQPSGFKFGIDKSDNQSKSDTTSPLNGFKFGSGQQNSGMAQFTFGIPKEENKAVSEAAKTTNSVTSSSSTGFVLNVKSYEKSESTNQNQESKQETLFGMPKSDSSTTASEKQNTSIVSSAPSTAPSFSFMGGFLNEKPGFAFPNKNQRVQSSPKKTSFATTVTESSKPAATTDAVPTSTNTTLPSLLTQKNITKNILDAKSEPTFSFGVSSSVSAVTTTSMNATTTCLPTFAQPTFTFSDTKTTSQLTTVPSFSQIPTSSATLSTSVSFGEKTTETTPTNKAINNTPVAPLFPIVSSSTPLFTNESKTTIAFGTDKPSSFTTTGSKPSGFVIPENKGNVPTFSSNTESKSPIFAASETKLPVFNSPTANPLSTFGTPSNSATSTPFGPTNTPTFGNNTTSAFGSATTTSAIFSTTKPVETNPASNNSSLFTFGSASSQQSASGGFNFSANVNPAASPAKPLFTFGSNSSTPQNSNNTFGSDTFGANSAPTNTNFAFNPSTKQEVPAAFGQGAAATPIFGAPQTNPQTPATSSFSSTPSSSAAFNFGSTAPAAATPGGFNFGGMSSTSASPGGFNFNSPASTPAVAFDPNSRPSFNFTKGSAPTAFNAPPQSAAAPRKIKKAFRRCVR